jgi:hypothetical protein
VSRRDPRERARARALARARAELAAAGASFDALSEAYQGYFRDRLGLPAGEITPRDLEARLEALGVPEDVRRRAVETLESLLSGRFGGAAGSAEELRARAVETLLAIERSPAARGGRP